MTFEELEQKVIEWAEARDIFAQGNVYAQNGKTLEEIGELLAAIAGRDLAAIKDARGDIEVTQIIVNEMLAREFGMKRGMEGRVECLEAAWNEIKDRKGKMVNGHFIREK